MDTIKIRVEGTRKLVSKSAYVKAKTRQLREFGYETLTEDEVTRQLDVILSGGEPNVIGMFIEGDLDREI